MTLRTSHRDVTAQARLALCGPLVLRWGACVWESLGGGACQKKEMRTSSRLSQEPTTRQELPWLRRASSRARRVQGRARDPDSWHTHWLESLGLPAKNGTWVGVNLTKILRHPPKVYSRA